MGIIFRFGVMLMMMMMMIVNILPYTKAQDIDLLVIEKLFNDHYAIHGVLEWKGFTRAFCDFMSPDDRAIVVGSKVEEEDVLLATYNVSNVRAQILTCMYGFKKNEASEGVSLKEFVQSMFNVCYVLGPNGRHYEMRRPPTSEGWDSFAIYQEVSPPARLEKLFYDHFKENGTLKWPPNRMETFCEIVASTDSLSVRSAQIITRNIVMYSLELTKIIAELLECVYQKEKTNLVIKELMSNGSKPETEHDFKYYAKGPNSKFYEMRLFEEDAPPNCDSQYFFIYQPAGIFM